MENLETIKKKLQKLRALYESAKNVNSEGEAAACAAAIQRILTQYNLTMEEVGCENNEQAGVEEMRIEGDIHNIGGFWSFHLMACIAEFNYCRCFMSGNHRDKLVLFGRRENIDTVVWLNNLLSERFVKFSSNRWLQFKHSEEGVYNKMTRGRFRRAYLMGAVRGLREKLEEEKRKNEPDVAVKINSLVLRRNTEIDEFIRRYQVGNRSTSRSLAKNAEEIGRVDGRNTQLYKPIATKQRNTASSVKMLG